MKKALIAMPSHARQDLTTISDHHEHRA